jgi:hypothetical protein
MKERHQKVVIYTSQKPKKEARIKTRFNPGLRSRKKKKKKKKKKIRVLKKHLNY